MRGHTHTAIAAAAVLSMGAGHPLQQAGMIVGAGVLGGLMNDLDHPHSEISKLLRPIDVIWWPVEQGEFRHGRRLLGLHTTWHRRGWHSFLVSLLLSQLVRIAFGLVVDPGLATVMALAYLVGSLTHLGADELNPSGCMLFWPLPVQVRLPDWLTVREDSFAGRMLERVVSLAAVAIITLEVGRMLPGLSIQDVWR
jgi:membrane-bound metal-dependent hydrolase YbcI (DUF457 family)